MLLGVTGSKWTCSLHVLDSCCFLYFCSYTRCVDIEESALIVLSFFLPAEQGSVIWGTDLKLHGLTMISIEFLLVISMLLQHLRS